MWHQRSAVSSIKRGSSIAIWRLHWLWRIVRRSGVAAENQSKKANKRENK